MHRRQPAGRSTCRGPRTQFIPRCENRWLSGSAGAIAGMTTLADTDLYLFSILSCVPEVARQDLVVAQWVETLQELRHT